MAHATLGGYDAPERAREARRCRGGASELAVRSAPTSVSGANTVEGFAAVPVEHTVKTRRAPRSAVALLAAQTTTEAGPRPFRWTEDPGKVMADVVRGCLTSNAPRHLRERQGQVSDYTNEFYKVKKDGSARFALVVAPLVLEMLDVRSVCDVGCGVGTWLSIFAERSISDLIGLNGDYVSRALLKTPYGCFILTDLEKPICLDRRFYSAVALGVAEHLSPSRAEGFVEDFTRLAPVVLFSEAIPNRGA